MSEVSQRPAEEEASPTIRFLAAAVQIAFLLWANEILSRYVPELGVVWRWSQAMIFGEGL